MFNWFSNYVVIFFATCDRLSWFQLFYRPRFKASNSVSFLLVTFSFASYVMSIIDSLRSFDFLEVWLLIDSVLSARSFLWCKRYLRNSCHRRFHLRVSSKMSSQSVPNIHPVREMGKRGLRHRQCMSVRISISVDLKCTFRFPFPLSSVHEPFWIWLLNFRGNVHHMKSTRIVFLDFLQFAWYISDVKKWTSLVMINQIWFSLIVTPSGNIQVIVKCELIYKLRRFHHQQYRFLGIISDSMRFGTDFVTYASLGQWIQRLRNPNSCLQVRRPSRELRNRKQWTIILLMTFISFRYDVPVHVNNVFCWIKRNYGRHFLFRNLVVILRSSFLYVAQKTRICIPMRRSRFQ